MRGVLGAVMIVASAPAVAEGDWRYAPVVLGCYDAATNRDGTDQCIGDAAATCMQTESDGYTTVGMSFCFSDEAGVWDELLNQEYRKARAFARNADADSMVHLPEYAIRADQLLAAQRAWIAFRDANCAMAYGAWGAGSMRQIAGAQCQMRMTAQRTLELFHYRTPAQ